MVFTCICQYVIIQYGGVFTKTEALSEEEWLATVVIGALVLPLGLIMRVISPQDETKRTFSGYADVQDFALSISSIDSSSQSLTENSYSLFSIVYHCILLGILPILAAVSVMCLHGANVPGSHFAPLAHFVEFTMKYLSISFPRMAVITVEEL